MMGFEPLDIDTTRFADRMGAGTGRLEQIEIVGEPLQIIKDFAHPGTERSMINRMPKVFLRMFKPLIDSITVRPKINGMKCTKCMMCVNSCPAKAIDGISFKINEKKCIMCFCCRELCRYNAVDLKESLLWKILSKSRKTLT
jgi:ferredoxin